MQITSRHPTSKQKGRPMDRFKAETETEATIVRLVQGDGQGFGRGIFRLIKVERHFDDEPEWLNLETAELENIHEMLGEALAHLKAQA